METFKDLNKYQAYYEGLAQQSGSSELLSALDLLNTVFDFVPGGSLFFKSIKNYDKFKKAIEPVAKFTKYTSSTLKKYAKGTTKNTMPFVLEAEMALSGKVTFENSLQGTENVFSTPGTADVNNTTEYGTTSDPAYPYYNEVLGTFALLKTPKFKQYNTQHLTNIEGPTGTLAFIRNLVQYYQFESNFEYVFNPVAHVDLEQTSIRAALVWETTGDTNAYTYPSEFNNVTEIPSFPSDNGEEGLEHKELVSDFVPIECLDNLYFLGNFLDLIEFDASNPEEVVRATVINRTDKLYLRLIIDYVFTDLDANGNPNRAMQILTYPIEVVDMTQSEFQNNLQTTADYLFHNFDPSGSPANLTL